MSHVSALVSDPGFELAYRTRVPAAHAPSSLLVLLHGVGGDETDLGALADGIAADTLVVLPRAPLTFGEGRFAWFQVSFTEAGPRIAADEADASRRHLIRFMQQLQARHGIPARRCAIAGFSQGGIMSASVALSAPECVGGFAVLAGRILPELEPAIAAREKLAHLHGLIVHGRDDTKLPLVWAQRADAWLEQLGVPHATRVHDGGHGISAAMAGDFIDWQRTLLSPARAPA